MNLTLSFYSPARWKKMQSILPGDNGSWWYGFESSPGYFCVRLLGVELFAVW